MLRTALVYVVPAIVIAAAWLRLEDPRETERLLWLLLLALAPALLPRLRWRLAAAIPATLLAAGLALRSSPLDEDRLLARLKDGVLEFYDVQLPFLPAEQPRMHGALLLGIFASTLAVALALASRRALLAVLAVLVGAGWPATLLAGGRELLLGAAILAACLVVLAGLRVRSPDGLGPAAVAAGLLVAAGVTAATTTTVARGGLVGWESWDLYDAPVRPVGVDYVWDASYDGIEFPRQKTTVLRVRAPQRGLYWRATTLDAFAADRWFENLYPVLDRPLDGPIPADPLVPRAPQEQWVRQEIQVVGLRDELLVGAATPVALNTREVGSVFLLSGGVVRAGAELERGDRYVVFSSVPSPTPEELASAPPDYPSRVAADLDVDPRVRMTPFGTPGREAAIRAELEDPGSRYGALRRYRPLVEAAFEVTRAARTPYAAVVALESWFRSTGGFRYEEQPAQPVGGTPPLVDFVARTKAGYCQHYAGAMALMLRWLGIPARVAVGFTSGTYDDGVWTVTDHDAHAWVEVWFPRVGWLSFDPTPGRGTLGAGYTTASDSADAIAAIVAAAASGAAGRGIDPTAGPSFGAPVGTTPADRDGGTSTLRLVLLLLAGLALAIGLVKLGVRRARYLTRDPRRQASAARSELEGFLRDQRLPVAVGATVADLRAVLRQELGVDAAGFASAAGAARYGPPDGSAEAARRARRELRRLLRVVRGKLSLGERARGWLAVRSLRRA